MRPRNRAEGEAIFKDAGGLLQSVCQLRTRDECPAPDRRPRQQPRRKGRLPRTRLTTAPGGSEPGLLA